MLATMLKFISACILDEGFQRGELGDFSLFERRGPQLLTLLFCIVSILRISYPAPRVLAEVPVYGDDTTQLLVLRLSAFSSPCFLIIAPSFSFERDCCLEAILLEAQNFLRNALI